MQGPTDGSSTGYLAAVGGQEAASAIAATVAAHHRRSTPWMGTVWPGHQGRIHLVAIAAVDLLRSSTDGFDGGIELTGAARVGEGITGTIRVRARKDIQARSAAIRLVGVLIAEEQRSETHHQHRQRAGRCVIVDRELGGGRRARHRGPDLHGTVPASVPLCPVRCSRSRSASRRPGSGHPRPMPGARSWRGQSRRTGTSRWARDERVAALVPVGQHPDLLRAGVVTLPPGAMFDSVDDEGRVPRCRSPAAARRGSAGDPVRRMARVHPAADRRGWS